MQWFRMTYQKWLERRQGVEEFGNRLVTTHFQTDGYVRNTENCHRKTKNKKAVAEWLAYQKGVEG